MKKRFIFIVFTLLLVSLVVYLPYSEVKEVQERVNEMPNPLSTINDNIGNEELDPAEINKDVNRFVNFLIDYYIDGYDAAVGFGKIFVAAIAVFIAALIFLSSGQKDEKKQYKSKLLEFFTEIF